MIAADWQRKKHIPVDRMDYVENIIVDRMAQKIQKIA